MSSYRVDLIDVVQRNIMLTIANDKFSHTPSDVNFHNHVPHQSAQFFATHPCGEEEKGRTRQLLCWLVPCTARVIGRSYAAQCGRFREMEWSSNKVHSWHSSGGERRRRWRSSRAALYHCNILGGVELSPHEFDYGFWRCHRGIGWGKGGREARTDAGRDGWRGNKHCGSFNNSQWVSTAGHWCYSGHLLFPPGPLFPPRAYPPSPQRAESENGPGRLQRVPQCDGSPGTFT